MTVCSVLGGDVVVARDCNVPEFQISLILSLRSAVRRTAPSHSAQEPTHLTQLTSLRSPLTALHCHSTLVQQGSAGRPAAAPRAAVSHCQWRRGAACARRGRRQPRHRSPHAHTRAPRRTAERPRLIHYPSTAASLTRTTHTPDRTRTPRPRARAFLIRFDVRGLSVNVNIEQAPDAMKE